PSDARAAMISWCPCQLKSQSIDEMHTMRSPASGLTSARAVQLAIYPASEERRASVGEGGRRIEERVIALAEPGVALVPRTATAELSVGDRPREIGRAPGRPSIAQLYHDAISPGPEPRGRHPGRRVAAPHFAAPSGFVAFEARAIR